MKERRNTFLSVLGIYLAGSWVVLQVVDVLKQNLGLPPWTFSLALTLLIIGLPIVLTTAWLQSRTRKDASSETPSQGWLAGHTSGRPGGAGGLFTWRNALLAGLAGLALWGVVATAWLVRDREADRTETAGASGSAPAAVRTGVLAVRTAPRGVTIEARTVESAEEGALAPAVNLGESPIAATLPAGETVVQLTGQDLVSLTLLTVIPAGDSASIDAELVPDSPITAEMVLVPSGPSPVAAGGGMPVEEFLVDRHEVTNSSYAEFMRDDGYDTPSLWPDSMIVEGALLDRAAALSRFTDLTGARGPRTWSGSVFPSGSGDHPVNGVSWYEARAYCLWQGKRLPSAAQWWRAALGAGERPYPWGSDAESMRARANFEASGTVPVESLPLGVSPFGAFEMAGNVREWVRPDGADALTALSVGGSWQDPVYTFTPEWREELPLGFANETTGFRCVRHAE